MGRRGGPHPTSRRIGVSSGCRTEPRATHGAVTGLGGAGVLCRSQGRREVGTAASRAVCPRLRLARWRHAAPQYTRDGPRLPRGRNSARGAPQTAQRPGAGRGTCDTGIRSRDWLRALCIEPVMDRAIPGCDASRVLTPGPAPYACRRSKGRVQYSAQCPPPLEARSLTACPPSRPRPWRRAPRGSRPGGRAKSRRAGRVRRLPVWLWFGSRNAMYCRRHAAVLPLLRRVR